MKMKSDETLHSLKNFIFNAFLAEDELFSLEKKGLPVKDGMPQAAISRIVESDFNPILWTQAMQMSSVYTILFCIENTLRNFIVERLAESKGLDWWDICVPQKIKDAAKKLKQSEAKTKYHSTRGDSFIQYTMLDSLAQIITNNWEDFSDIIPNQAWIVSRMDDLTTCRNVIMHTGVLPGYEIERIESIARDFLWQLG